MTGRPDRGFTLIEMLVAITIMGLFVTASMGAVRVGSRSWAAGHQYANSTEEMRATADFLRRQFAQIPPLAFGRGDDRRIRFRADEKRLLFVAPAPTFSQGGGLVTYLLAVEPHDGEDWLTLNIAGFDPGSEQFDFSTRRDPIVLGKGFDDIRMSYFGRDTDDEPPYWRSEWRSDAPGYPLAIRVSTRPRTGEPGWPDFVYPLRSGDRP